MVSVSQGGAGRGGRPRARQRGRAAGRAAVAWKPLVAREGQGMPVRPLLAPHARPMCTSSAYGRAEEEDNEGKSVFVWYSAKILSYI